MFLDTTIRCLTHTITLHKDKDGALLGDPIETVVHGDGDILMQTMDEEKSSSERRTTLPFACVALQIGSAVRREASIAPQSPRSNGTWAGVVYSTVGAPITLSILSSRAITRRLASSS